MFDKWYRTYMAEDGGAGAGGAGGAGGDASVNTGTDTGAVGAGGADASQGAELPKYFSQFSPEHRGDASWQKALGGFKSLDDLAKAYVDMDSRKGDYIKRIGKDSTDDEVRAWAKEMGIPESKEAYKFADEDKAVTAEDKGALNAWKEIAWKNGMNSRQAEAAWAYVKGLGTVGMARQAQAMQIAKDTLSSNLAQAYEAESPSTSAAEGKARAAQGYFAKFMESTGTKAALEQSGLAYDPAFVKGVAALMQSVAPPTGGGTTVGGGSGRGLGAFGDSYAESSRKFLGI